MADSKNGKQGSGPAAAKGPLADTGADVKRRKKITKVEAVRRALVALGEQAERPDIQGYVRQKFGLQIGLDHISNCKSELAKRAAKAAKNAVAPAQAAMRPAASTPGPQTRIASRHGSSGDTVQLQDVLLAKELLDRVGAGPLRTLLDGLAK